MQQEGSCGGIWEQRYVISRIPAEVTSGEKATQRGKISILISGSRETVSGTLYVGGRGKREGGSSRRPSDDFSSCHILAWEVKTMGGKGGERKEEEGEEESGAMVSKRNHGGRGRFTEAYWTTCVRGKATQSVCTEGKGNPVLAEATVTIWSPRLYVGAPPRGRRRWHDLWNGWSFTSK